MCPPKDWFSTYDPVDSSIVHIGNNVQCNVAGIDTIKIKALNGVIRTLPNVCHIPDLKSNLISLDILESKGCKYSSKGRVLKVSKGTRILLKESRQVSMS